MIKIRLFYRSGAVYGWGKNGHGQLGLNDTNDRHFPTQLRSLRSINVCHHFALYGNIFKVFMK